ncbi:hypothetical protein [Streptomyces chilikensis]|uniref:hypothetical protein n=1 Tax=Streptomyces chilikensis TaxID=1194079 RepID=UPI000AB8679B|nr:hypothetical protein [Streptomyces chilikensis]
MRLNQLAPAGGGGSAPDLASSPAQKKAAAKAIDEVLLPTALRDGKHAAETTKAAVKEFAARDGEGWDSSSALDKVGRTWERQVKSLLDRLAAESKALRKTTVVLHDNDLGTAARISQPSAVDHY